MFPEHGLTGYFLYDNASQYTSLAAANAKVNAGIRKKIYKGFPPKELVSETVEGSIEKFTWLSNKQKPLDAPFTIVWEGVLKIDKQYNYTFILGSDDGSLLFIDDEMIIDNRGAHATQEKQAKINLLPGLHNIRIQYCDLGGGAALYLKWAYADVPMSLLPPTVFFHYHTINKDINTPGNKDNLGTDFIDLVEEEKIVLKRNDSAISFKNKETLRDNYIKNWGHVGSPMLKSGFNYNIIWKGFLDIPVAGKYEFRTITNGRVMLYLESGKRALNFNNRKYDIAIDLKKGRIPVQINYRNNYKYATLSLLWKRPKEKTFKGLATKYLYPAEKVGSLSKSRLYYAIGIILISLFIGLFTFFCQRTFVKSNIQKDIELLKKGYYLFCAKLADCYHVILFLILFKVILFSAGICFYILIKDNFRVNNIFDIFNRWDARHYVTIAESGYTVTEDGTLIHLVFPPVWPFFVYLGGFLFNNAILSGLILSNVSSIIAGLVFYYLIKRDYGERISLFATLLVFIYPAGFYFNVPYSESIFFLFVLCFFYALGSKNFLLAAVFGFFASSTRLMGFLVVVPYVVDYYLSFKLSFNRRIFYPLIIICGFATYLYMNYHYTDNLFAFLEIQKTHWTHKSSSMLNIPFAIYTNFKSLLFAKSVTSREIITNKIEPLFSFIALITLISGRKLMKPSWFFYGIVYMILIFSQSYWLSNTRYIMMIFPVFLVWARYFFELDDKKFRFALGFCFALLCVMLMTVSYALFVIGNITLL